MIGIGVGLWSGGRPRKSEDDEVPKKYLFIDGAFLRSFIQDNLQIINRFEAAFSIDWSKIGHGYDRVLFYDAYPERKDGQSEEAFQKEQHECESFFRFLSEIPNYNVRPALSRRGKRREQKGVDVLLAIECLMHAIRGNIDEAVVMTSDLDFFPLFEALLQTKTRSTLMYQLERTSNDLIGAADKSIPLTLWSVAEWYDTRFSHLVSGYGIGTSEIKCSTEIRVGTAKDRSFQLFTYMTDGTQKYYVAEGNEILTSGKRLECFAVAEAERNIRARILWSA